MENIKWINSQLKGIKLKINELVDQKILIQQEIDKAKKSYEELDNRLLNLQKEPQLSEHAILRYLERVRKIDMDVVKQDIMTPRVIDQIKIIGAGIIPAQGYKILVKNNVITTIVL